MPAMKVKSMSDSSESESIDYSIADEINATYTRLRAIISEEANVRKTLGALFLKQKDEAIEAVRKAQQHLASVNDEETRMRDVLRKETEAANEAECTIIAGSAGIVCKISANGLHGGTQDTIFAEKKPENELELDHAEGVRQAGDQLEQEQTERQIEDSTHERQCVEQEALAAEEREVFAAEGREAWEYALAEELGRIDRADEEARLQAEWEQKEEARRIREEEAIEKERKQEQEAAMIAAIEERRTAEAEQVRREQEALIAEEQARHEHELIERARRLAFQDTSAVVIRKLREARERQQNRSRINGQGQLQFLDWDQRVHVLGQERDIMQGTQNKRQGEIVDEYIASILEAPRLEAEKSVYN